MIKTKRDEVVTAKRKGKEREWKTKVSYSKARKRGDGMEDISMK